jgi:hypothetical protein
MRWSDVALSTMPMTNFLAGPALLTLITNGIPSVSRVVDIHSSLHFTPPANQTAPKGEIRLFALGSFTDAINGNLWSVTVAWGDGTLTLFSMTTTGELLPQLHSYGDEGVYTVTVTIRDSKEGMTLTSFQIMANPTALEEDAEPLRSNFIFLPLIATQRVPSP